MLLVDQASASTGWAGMGSRTAGLLSFVTREDDPEDFIKYSLENIGFYLNDQNALRDYAYGSRMIPERLSQWGAEVSRDDKGRIDYAKWPFPFGTAAIDPDVCHALAKRAKQLGVRFLDHVAIVEFFTDGGHVKGAAGFSLGDGTFCVFEADAVVVAMGSQNYDIVEMWCGTGNGIRAAYLAGAEMRNVEFGNMCDFARVDARGWLYYGAHGAAHTAHDHLVNAKGENISQKYRPGSAHLHGPGGRAGLVQGDLGWQRARFRSTSASSQERHSSSSIPRLPPCTHWLSRRPTIPTRTSSKWCQGSSARCRASRSTRRWRPRSRGCSPRATRPAVGAPAEEPCPRRRPRCTAWGSPTRSSWAAKPVRQRRCTPRRWPRPGASPSSIVRR